MGAAQERGGGGGGAESHDDAELLYSLALQPVTAVLGTILSAVSVVVCQIVAGTSKILVEHSGLA